MSKIELVLSSIILGIAASFLSLLVLVGLESYFQVAPKIVLPVIIEEFIKLFLLWKLISLWENSRKYSIISSFFLGIGFGIFEIFLIFLKESAIPPQALIIPIIHAFSGIFLGMAVASDKRVKTALFIIFALAIHLCYNLIAVNL